MLVLKCRGRYVRYNGKGIRLVSEQRRATKFGHREGLDLFLDCFATYFPTKPKIVRLVRAAERPKIQWAC